MSESVAHGVRATPRPPRALFYATNSPDCTVVLTCYFPTPPPPAAGLHPAAHAQGVTRAPAPGRARRVNLHTPHSTFHRTKKTNYM